MLTAAIKPRLSVICDCCGEVAVRKGGTYPHYLCETHAQLAEADVAERMREKYGSRS